LTAILTRKPCCCKETNLIRYDTKEEFVDSKAEWSA